MFIVQQSARARIDTHPANPSVGIEYGETIDEPAAAVAAEIGSQEVAVDVAAQGGERAGAAGAHRIQYAAGVEAIARRCPRFRRDRGGGEQDYGGEKGEATRHGDKLRASP